MLIIAVFIGIPPLRMTPQELLSRKLSFRPKLTTVCERANIHVWETQKKLYLYGIDEIPVTTLTVVDNQSQHL